MGILSLFLKLLCHLFFIYSQVSASKDTKNITAQSGQNVTLMCRAPNNNILVVEWSRADLQLEYVLLYRDEVFFPEYQHLSFKNRVDLQDRQMKDGDVSLILKDVTINDTGTYECRVAKRGTNRGKRANLKTPPISIIYLSVVVPPDTTIVIAEAAQNVSLPCRAPNNNIRVLQWSRDGLKAEDIFVYRNKMVDPDNQHQSFKNRVYLQDRQMKDGDVSLILNNVTITDTGTYKCRVLMEETRLWKVSSITLRVDPPGQRGGHTEDGGKVVGRGHFWLVASTLLLLLLIFALVITSKLSKKNLSNHLPSDESAASCSDIRVSG